MSQVIIFRRPEDVRKKCKFINKPVRYLSEDGAIASFPCVVVYDIETDVPVLYTGLEDYVVRVVESGVVSEATQNKRTINVCTFLNYLLWEEPEINGIEDISMPVVRRFMNAYKTKDDGTPRKRNTWIVCCNDVFRFLSNYYNKHKDHTIFNYKDTDLVNRVVIRDRTSARKIVINKHAALNTKPPRDTRRKNRVLMHGYLDLMLFEAKKHAPDLVLPIALGAYGGLREGEIANLSTGSLRLMRGAYGVATGLEVDLTQDAPWNLLRDKKTNTGSIKKFRIQRIYHDFVDVTWSYYEEQLQRVEENYKSRGMVMPANGPLFLNQWGQPLTVSAYTARLKTFFYRYFLPALERYSKENNLLAENVPYIEAYEKEYPGAHMFRHWFTMYLLTKKKLSNGEIMRWRGDSSVQSMESYIHENYEMLEAYDKAAFYFQESILGGLDEVR